MGETEGETESYLMGRAMLSKSLIQISVDGQECVPALLFDLKPNYDGGNEDNDDRLQNVPCRHCYTQWPQPSAGRGRPTAPLETPGTSGSVSCGVTAPFSWVLVHKVLSAPSGVCFPALWSSGSSVGELMVSSSKRAYATPRSAASRAPPLWPSTSDPYLRRRCSITVLPQSLWGPWVLVHTRLVWALWAPLVGMGFDSKCDFGPPTVLLGILLCLWTWGISPKSLQHHQLPLQGLLSC